MLIARLVIENLTLRFEVDEISSNRACGRSFQGPLVFSKPNHLKNTVVPRPGIRKKPEKISSVAEIMQINVQCDAVVSTHLMIFVLW